MYAELGDQVDTALTGGSGEAGFVDLVPGTYYASAAATGYATEYYWDSPDLGDATPLTGGSDFSDTADIALAGPGGGTAPSIEGTASGSGGTAIDSAQVQLYEYNSFWDKWWEYDTAYTDSTGSYSFTGLETGVGVATHGPEGE